MDIISKIISAIHRFIVGRKTPEEVAKTLDALAKANPERLDWRHSVVDLLKVTNRDSGLQARKNMARELGYTGPLDGSAAMNTWLHDKLMEQLR